MTEHVLPAEVEEAFNVLTLVIEQPAVPLVATKVTAPVPEPPAVVSTLLPPPPIYGDVAKVRAAWVHLEMPVTVPTLSPKISI